MVMTIMMMMMTMVILIELIVMISYYYDSPTSNLNQRDTALPRSFGWSKGALLQIRPLSKGFHTGFHV